MSKPGDGLPPIELFIARILFRIFRSGKSDGALRVKFDRETKLVVQLIESMDESQLMQPVTIPRVMGIEEVSRHWSSGMTLHHLNTVNSGISKIIDQLESGITPSLVVRIEDVKPPATVSPHIREEFKSMSDMFLSRMKEIGELRGSRTHPHPWFGPLDSHGWHTLAAMHQGIHRRQVAMIKALLPR